jgi:hypothetical protein
MIAIGVDAGGPELRGMPIKNLLLAAMNLAIKYRLPNYDDGTVAWINPIYLVPGTVWKPDFEGYKLGHFSRKQKGLVVMIVVPQSVADGEGIPEFIAASLREAVRLADIHFASKKISFPTLEAEKIIMAIKADLNQI